MVGLCGGYRTFSAFSLQTLDLMRSGAMMRATINIVASVVLCVSAVAVGHVVAAHFNAGATQIAQLPIEEEADGGRDLCDSASRRTPLWKKINPARLSAAAL